MDDLSIKETIITNICIIEVLVPAAISIKSTRNLNVIAINANAAGMLSDLQNEKVEIRSLLQRFKNIDNRENFSYLLQLLKTEPKETSWLK